MLFVSEDEKGKYVCKLNKARFGSSVGEPTLMILLSV